MKRICFSVPLPCIMSEWTSWAGPDSTGTFYRYRWVLRPALNGGKECSKENINLKKSTLDDNIACFYTPHMVSTQ